MLSNSLRLLLGCRRSACETMERHRRTTAHDVPRRIGRNHRHCHKHRKHDVSSWLIGSSATRLGLTDGERHRRSLCTQRDDYVRQLLPESEERFEVSGDDEHRWFSCLLAVFSAARTKANLPAEANAIS